MIKQLPLFIFLLFHFSFSQAQSDAYRAFQIAQEAVDEDPEEYLAPIRALQMINYKTTDPLALSTMAQAEMTYFSFVGDYEYTLMANVKRFGPERDPAFLQVRHDSAFVDQHTFVEARDFILQKAEEEQVIMINEAHHIPYHRSFVHGLLKGLYEKGFRYLAVETLSDDDINALGYPDHSSGFYSREPLFGEMLREALKTGFRLVPYESQQECADESDDRYYCSTFRDSVQAVNIKERIFEEDTGAKVLVFAGYDHIHKGSHNSWIKMAQFVERMTGIEPFCVDQTTMMESLNLAYENRTYYSVMELVAPEEPVIAVKEEKPYAHGPFVDATVFHPRTEEINDRPGFYSIDGRRKPFRLGVTELEEGQLVQAFYVGEKGYRIPADQFVVRTGRESLFLFPGAYELVIRGMDGENVIERVIEQR